LIDTLGPAVVDSGEAWRTPTKRTCPRVLWSAPATHSLVSESDGGGDAGTSCDDVHLHRRVAPM